MIIHPPRILRRLPLLAGGIAILVLAMWGGLLRMGWPWPMPGTGAVVYHGPLMIGGFLGTLLSLERAVALGRAWPYAGPLAAALGGVCLLLGLPVMCGQILLLAASVVLTAVFITIVRRQTAAFTITMGLGAAAWLVGNALWLAGWSIPAVVPWWIAFLILTIVGERLELSRFLAKARGKQTSFIVAGGIYGLGVILTLVWPGLGWAVSGVGMLALALWLTMYDLAWRTVRQRGMTGFVAVCLLTGYFWLAVGGGLAFYHAVVAPILADVGGHWLYQTQTAGLGYDQILHAVLLGFVFSMIFGHALIIFPSVLGVRMDYHPRFYAHVVLLDLSVLLRIVADGLAWETWRQWGGLLNAAAIVLFLIQTVSSIKRRKVPRATRASPPPHGKTIRLSAHVSTPSRGDSAQR